MAEYYKFKSFFSVATEAYERNSIQIFISILSARGTMNSSATYPAEHQQIIEKQKKTIDGLEITNEKLRRRAQFYENFLENVAQFEKTQNAIKFKEFLASVAHSPRRSSNNLFIFG